MVLNKDTYSRFKETFELLLDKRIIKNNTEIVEKIGYNKDYISRGIGRKLIDDSLINKILEVINVSKNDFWNQIDKNILSNNNVVQEPEAEYRKSIPKNIIPLYDVRASAGTGFANLSENVLDYIANEQLKGLL